MSYFLVFINAFLSLAFHNNDGLNVRKTSNIDIEQLSNENTEHNSAGCTATLFLYYYLLLFCIEEFEPAMGEIMLNIDPYLLFFALPVFKVLLE